MPIRSLGPGLPEVGVVGYGAWPLSDHARRPETDDAVRAIHAALDGGATLIDTADAYCRHDGEVGHNERLIAKALRQWPGDRDRITVATKGGFVRPDGVWAHNARPDHLRDACDRSLAALGVDRIDLYQLHAPDPDVPLDESVGMLAELRSAGKIRAIGLSNVSVSEIERARSVTEITTVQNRLNPFFREAVDDGVVRYCDREGLGFLAYSPLGGGRLNLKLPQVPALQEVARAHGASEHAATLAWVLARGASVIVIPAGRTVEHVRDSQRSATLALDDEELAAIDAAEFSIA